MKPYFKYSILLLFILSSCKDSQKKEVIEVKSVKWKLDKITVLDTATSRFVPYFQKTDSIGQNGYVELKDYGVKGQELKIYDGTGVLIIDSEILGLDEYKGGFNARTVFYYKPNKRKSMELVQRNGDRELTKENTVFDPITKVQGIIRFIPDLAASKALNLIGVQFDISDTKESVSVRFY